LWYGETNFFDFMTRKQARRGWDFQREGKILLVSKTHPTVSTPVQTNHLLFCLWKGDAYDFLRVFEDHQLEEFWSQRQRFMNAFVDSRI